MERVNGYYKLDSYFKHSNMWNLEDAGLITLAKKGSAALFWFNYHGNKILFKTFRTEYASYSELVSEALANYLGLPTAHYDLATFGSKQGVISYNFLNSKFKSTDFEDILFKYILDFEIPDGKTYGDLREISFGEIKLDPSDINTNLEDIWNALEYYLYHKLNFTKELIPEMVSKIMLKITDYFCFQIISGNHDFNSRNLILEYSENEDYCDLAPLFDNEDMFKAAGDILYGGLNTPRIALTRCDFENNIDYLGVLKSYLQISDSIFVERFKKMVKDLDFDTIYYLFEIIEENTERTMPEDIKEKIGSEFNNRLKELKKLLHDLEISRTRKKGN